MLSRLAPPCLEPPDRIDLDSSSSWKEWTMSCPRCISTLESLEPWRSCILRFVRRLMEAPWRGGNLFALPPNEASIPLEGL